MYVGCSVFVFPYKRQSYAFQTGATGERTIADACYAVGNGDAGQTGAIGERAYANARYAVGNGDADQTGAIGERAYANARYASIGWNHTVFTTLN